MNYKKPILFLLLLFINCITFAQDINSDSTTNIEDPNRADTILIQNLIKLKPADIQEYRSSKDFAYMQYLDSMLKEVKDLKSDTMSINNLRPNKTHNIESNDEMPPSLTFLDNPILKIFMWLLAASFIGFILFKLFSTGGFFQKKTQEQKNIDIDEQELNLGIDTYEELIKKVLFEKNYRLAIRYLYLQTLQKLNEKNIIYCSPEKTNYQYARELTGKPYQNEFASLTMSYDYVWYGKFNINSGTYENIEKEFKSFQQRI